MRVFLFCRYFSKLLTESVYTSNKLSIPYRHLSIRDVPLANLAAHSLPSWSAAATFCRTFTLVLYSWQCLQAYLRWVKWHALVTYTYPYQWVGVMALLCIQIPCSLPTTPVSLVSRFSQYNVKYQRQSSFNQCTALSNWCWHGVGMDWSQHITLSSICEQ